MEEALRQELTMAAVAASKDTGKIVMVHVGASRESEALRLAAHAVAAGADAIASIPVSKNDEFCIENDEFCSKDDDLCI